MKKSKLEKTLLEVLEKVSNISIACDKVGISRYTFYRWRNEDKKFAKKVEKAMRFGDESVCDLVDSKIISAVKNGDWKALKFVAEKRHPKYKKYKPTPPEAVAESESGEMKFVIVSSREEIEELDQAREKLRKLQEES